MESDKHDTKKIKVTEIKTFPVAFTLEEIKKNISIATKAATRPDQEQVINQAFKLHSQGNICIRSLQLICPKRRGQFL